MLAIGNFQKGAKEDFTRHQGARGRRVRQPCPKVLQMLQI